MRRNLIFLTALAALLLPTLKAAENVEPRQPTPLLCYPKYDPAKFHVLQDDLYEVLIDRRCGVISRIRDKASGLDLLIEPRLADNWRICLPIPATLTDPGTQANYFLGKDQKLTAAEPTPSGLTLRWAGPLRSINGAKFPVSATMQIRLADGAIEFQLDVDNHSPLKLMEVWFPLLGGLQGLGARKSTWVHIPWGQGEQNSDIFWNTGLPRDLGNPYPEYLFLVEPGKMPQSWMDVFSKELKRGFYFGLHDPNGGGRKLLRIEMQPGVGLSRLGGDTWPRPEEVPPDVPVGLTLSWVHFFAPTTMATNSGFHGGTVVVRAHAGDWQEAVRFYPR